MAAEGEAQVLEEQYLTPEERLARAQRKFELAIECDKEAEGWKVRMKDAEKRADAARAEAEALVMKRENPQLEIPTAPESPDWEICPEDENGIHDWHRIRQTDEVYLDDCAHCGLERTAKIPEEGVEPAWIYTKPEGPAAPLNEVVEAEANAATVEEPADV